MISKELLSEVLDCEIMDMGVEGSDVTYLMPSKCHWIDINIYELAHECKEWAYDRYGDEVSSMKSYFAEYEKKLWYSTTSKYYEISLDGFYADTEPEAIFKACEWILKDNK